MKYIYVSLLTALSLGSCSTNSFEKKKDASHAEALYPFPQYIQSQIAYVDSVPLALEMTVQVEGVTTDSSFISREVFKRLAAEFTNPDPNERSLRPEYEESSFNDLSLNSITFSITTKNTRLPLQQADVLLNPDSKQVRYLVLKKQATTNEGLVTSSLLWRHNMNFQIVSSTVTADGKEHSKLVRVVWDKPLNELNQ